MPLSLIVISFTWTSSQEENKVSLVKFEELSPFLNKEDTLTHVVNFWATWCGPFVKKMPDFQKTYEDLVEEVDFLLVSLDFPSENERVNKYIQKKKITIPGYQIDETDGNSWIPQVSKEWLGHIPATLVYNKSTGFNKIHIGGLYASELKDFIN